MTLRIPFANDAKQYDFGYLRHLAETLLNSEGVANYGTDLVVTNAATGLRVDIAAGAAWVKGDSGTPAMGISQGLFSVVNDAAVANAVTLPTAHATNPRIDQIVLKVRDSADLASGADDALFDYVQGTATGGATLVNRTGAAALPNDCLRLADVLVPAAATNLVAANVRDRRIPATGKANRYNAAVDTTPGASYTELTVPDLVEVYVPANGVVRLQASALIKNPSVQCLATVFVIDYAATTPVATELKQTALNTAGGGLFVGQGPSASSFYSPIGSAAHGMQYGQSTGTDTSEPSTGTVMALGGVGVEPMSIYGLAAGNYGFSIRYKAASGTTSVKERRVNAEVVGNGRSQ